MFLFPNSTHDGLVVHSRSTGTKYTLRRRLLASVVGLSLALTACQSTEQFVEELKQAGDQIGKAWSENPEFRALGLAVLGGVVGAQFGQGRGKIAAVLVGALAGAALSKLIDNMSNDDKAALAQAQGAVIAGDGTNTEAEWTNPDTNTKIKVVQTSEGTKDTTTNIIRPTNVDTPGKMRLIGEPYEVIPNLVNVRAGPTTSKAVVRRVKQGDVLTVVGQPVGTNWYMVGVNGVSVGYIREDLLKKADVSPKSGTSGSTTPLPAPGKDADEFSDVQNMLADVNEVYSTPDPGDTVDAEYQEANVSDVIPMTAGGQTAIRPADGEGSIADLLNDAADEGADVDGFVVEEIDVRTVCREVETTITVDGDSASETGEACKAGDGAWEVGAT